MHYVERHLCLSHFLSLSLAFSLSLACYLSSGTAAAWITVLVCGRNEPLAFFTNMYLNLYLYVCVTPHNMHLLYVRKIFLVIRSHIVAQTFAQCHFSAGPINIVKVFENRRPEVCNNKQQFVDLRSRSWRTAKGAGASKERGLWIYI